MNLMLATHWLPSDKIDPIGIYSVTTALLVAMAFSGLWLLGRRRPGTATEANVSVGVRE